MELLEISQEDARKSKGIYLDVRRNNERDRGHVEKDIHIPTSELERRYDEIPKDKEIIVYCGGGSRSLYSTLFLQSKKKKEKSLQGGYRRYNSE